MIIDDLDVESAAFVPAKTDPPLFVYPDAVLPRPVSFQRFQSVPGRHAQALQPARGVKHSQLSQGELLHFKHEAIDLAEQNARELPEPAGVEIGMDVEVMRIQAERLHKRAQYWRSRVEGGS